MDIITKNFDPEAQGMRLVTARVQNTSKPRVFLVTGHGDCGFMVSEIDGHHFGAPIVAQASDQNLPDRAQAYRFIEEIVRQEAGTDD